MVSSVLASGNQNSEIDDLIHRFQSGLSSLAEKTGIQNMALGDGAFSLEAADRTMKELLDTLERTVIEARQRAANSRSSETLQTIEKLRFI